MGFENPRFKSDHTQKGGLTILEFSGTSDVQKPYVAVRFRLYGINAAFNCMRPQALARAAFVVKDLSQARCSHYDESNEVKERWTS